MHFHKCVDYSVVGELLNLAQLMPMAQHMMLGLFYVKQNIAKPMTSEWVSVKGVQIKSVIKIVGKSIVGHRN